MSQSKSNIFLTEFIFCILLFSVTSVLCIQVFIKAYFLSNKANDIANSVLAAESVAETLQSTYSLAEAYSVGNSQNNLFLLYYDKNWKSCKESNASFSITVSPYPINNSEDIIIDVINTSEKESLYTLNLKLHKQNIYGGSKDET